MAGCATGGIAFALVFGTSQSDAIIVGSCLALSSTPVAVGSLTKEEHQQPHGELLLGSVHLSYSCSNTQTLTAGIVCHGRVLIVQDGIFGILLAGLSAMGDGTTTHGARRGNGGDGQDDSTGATLWIVLGCVVLGLACWFTRRRLHQMHNLCFRQIWNVKRFLHWLHTWMCGTWLSERLVNATWASNETVLLASLCAMATGRTITEELGERVIFAFIHTWF